MPCNTQKGLWDSVGPAYPGYTHGLPTDLNDFDCEQWIVYYKRLEAAYGVSLADQYISGEFARETSWFSFASCRTAIGSNCAFYDTFKHLDIIPVNAWAEINCSGNVAFEDIMTGVKRTSGVIRWLPLLLVAGGVGWVYMNRERLGF